MLKYVVVTNLLDKIFNKAFFFFFSCKARQHQHKIGISTYLIGATYLHTSSLTSLTFVAMSEKTTFYCASQLYALPPLLAPGLPQLSPHHYPCYASRNKVAHLTILSNSLQLYSMTPRASSCEYRGKSPNLTPYLRPAEISRIYSFDLWVTHYRQMC